MTRRLKHIGVDSFFAERVKILDRYDQVKQQSLDDPVKVEHGIVGEILIREWLKSFLPKRFGVCKGYIITTNLEYNGVLEEWDVIIYDAIESPILFTRGEGLDANNSGQKRAVPVEYVRAVIEVKAKLNPKSAKDVFEKLQKLVSFIGVNQSDKFPQFFCLPFVSATIFLETDVNSLKQYRKALDGLCEIYTIQQDLRFMGALILRSQREPKHSGYLQLEVMNEPFSYPDVFEMSSVFPFSEDQYGQFGCLCYSVNSYPKFIFDLLANVKGINYPTSSLYGLDYEDIQGSRLFH